MLKSNILQKVTNDKRVSQKLIKFLFVSFFIFTLEMTEKCVSFFCWRLFLIFRIQNFQTKLIPPQKSRCCCYQCLAIFALKHLQGIIYLQLLEAQKFLSRHMRLCHSLFECKEWANCLDSVLWCWLSSKAQELGNNIVLRALLGSQEKSHRTHLRKVLYRQHFSILCLEINSFSIKLTLVARSTNQ